jgi:hypothetical protein
METVRELKDRQEIYDCMMRYCRGVDRLDRALLQSCYHPDAFDDHGAYVGPAAGFIDWVLKIYEDHKLASHHEITNHFVEIEGNTAHAESYWVASSIDAAPPHYSIARGRYVDRLEKREGRWAIVDRACLVEISPQSLPAELDQLTRKLQPRDRSDLSFARPLRLAART